MTHGKANEAGTSESYANDSWRTIHTETTMEQWPVPKSLLKPVSNSTKLLGNAHVLGGF